MNIEEYRDYCLAKPGTTESFPFDEKVLVFKVGGKMYALADIESFEFINLKCDPERSVELREHHPEIQPGWHMNKKLWNSVYVTGSLTNPFIFELIDHSYDVIVASLPKKVRSELGIRD